MYNSLGSVHGEAAVWQPYARLCMRAKQLAETVTSVVPVLRLVAPLPFLFCSRFVQPVPHLPLQLGLHLHPCVVFTLGCQIRSLKSPRCSGSLQVAPAVQVMQQLIDSESPGVAALMLHRLQQQADRCWGQTAGLTSIRAFLNDCCSVVL